MEVVYNDVGQKKYFNPKPSVMKIEAYHIPQPSGMQVVKFRLDHVARLANATVPAKGGSTRRSNDYRKVIKIVPYF